MRDALRILGDVSATPSGLFCIGINTKRGTMSDTANELSGAAEDVLHALFFRGALESGDLPSKSGAAELRAAGLAETRTLRA